MGKVCQTLPDSANKHRRAAGFLRQLFLTESSLFRLMIMKDLTCVSNGGGLEKQNHLKGSVLMPGRLPTMPVRLWGFPTE
jgi:hypothetical protein